MKASRFTAEQIVAILQEATAGAQVRELCRRHGVTETTFYRWRRQYGGLQVNETKRLKALEEENRRLKKLVPISPSIMRCLKTWRDTPGDDHTTAARRHLSPSRLSRECPPRLPTRAA